MEGSTLIVVHPKENRKKCSVEPLRGREGFEFETFSETPQPLLQNTIRLGLGGELLTREDNAYLLLVLDGTWRYADTMERLYADVPVRSLLDWQTAYPRISKWYDDPDGGLATIEAIYAAHWQMGRKVSGLLDEYHWGDEFLSRNASLIQSVGDEGLSSDAKPS